MYTWGCWNRPSAAQGGPSQHQYRPWVVAWRHQTITQTNLDPAPPPPFGLWFSDTLTWQFSAKCRFQTILNLVVSRGQVEPGTKLSPKPSFSCHQYNSRTCSCQKGYQLVKNLVISTKTVATVADTPMYIWGYWNRPTAAQGGPGQHRYRPWLVAWRNLTITQTNLDPAPSPPPLPPTPPPPPTPTPSDQWVNT